MFLCIYWTIIFKLNRKNKCQTENYVIINLYIIMAYKFDYSPPVSSNKLIYRFTLSIFQQGFYFPGLTLDISTEHLAFLK